MKVKTDFSFGKDVRQRRYGRHLSQKELADLVGCSQTTISNVEAGDWDTLSKEKIERLCDELKLNPPTEPQSDTIIGFCSNFDCPAAWRTVINSRLVVKPKMFHVQGGTTRFCKACGGILATTCQEASCQASPEEGASFCTHCSAPLVRIEKYQQGGDLEEFAERMNQRSKELDESCRQTEALSPKQPRERKTAKQ